MDADVERALIERAQSGDLLAYQELFTFYRPRIFRIVDHLLKNRADAEDAVQDIFLKLFRVLGSYRGQSSFFTWVYRIATNAAHARLEVRSRQAQVMVDSGDDAIEHTSSPEYDQPDVAHGRAELLHTLDDAIAGLSPGLREAFLLREMDGLDYSEIAELTGTPLGTVKSRVSRAKNQLAAQLSAYRASTLRSHVVSANMQSSGKDSNRN